METHSSILAWEIPWTEEPVGYSPWGCKESDMTGHKHTCMPGDIYCMDLGKYIKTCIHCYSIIQHSFTALKIICTMHSLHLSILPPSSQFVASTGLCTVCIALPFLESQSVGIMQQAAFSDWPFHLVTHAWVSFVCIHCLSAPLFLLLVDTPLSGWTTTCLPIYPLKVILVIFKFWQIRIRLLQTCACPFVWM